MKKGRFIAIALTLLFYILACDDIIEVDDISQHSVSLLAPSNDVILNTTSVSFNWDTVNDAEAYNIQIAMPSFENAIQIITDSTLTATNFSTTLEIGEYQWRVRAENSAYQTQYATRNFVILGENPIDISNSQIELIAPANNVSFLTTDSINFSWESVTDAEMYTIQIATPDFDNATELIENTTQTETTFTISNLTANNYQWRVKASNSVSETNYSTNSFIVEE